MTTSPLVYFSLNYTTPQSLTIDVLQKKIEVSSLWNNKQLAWTQNQISGKVWQREDLKIPNQNGNNFLLTSILSLKISELWPLVIFWKDIPTCPAFSGEIKVCYVLTLVMSLTGLFILNMYLFEIWPRNTQTLDNWPWHIWHQDIWPRKNLTPGYLTLGYLKQARYLTNIQISVKVSG